MATATDIRPGVLIRKARDHTIDMPHQPGQAHRSAAGKTIDYRLQEITDGKARAISTVPGMFIDKPLSKGMEIELEADLLGPCP